jgi:hypothetical protein
VESLHAHCKAFRPIKKNKHLWNHGKWIFWLIRRRELNKPLIRSGNDYSPSQQVIISANVHIEGGLCIEGRLPTIGIKVVTTRNETP